jgi:hypothetical protein
MVFEYGVLKGMFWAQEVGSERDAAVIHVMRFIILLPMKYQIIHDSIGGTCSIHWHFDREP